MPNNKPRKRPLPEDNHIIMRSWYCFDCSHQVCYVGRLRDRAPCALCGATYTRPPTIGVEEANEDVFGSKRLSKTIP